MFEILHDWFWGLGAQYGVNPLIFGSIYVGAIPFFTVSLAWLIRNLQQQRSIIVPALSTAFFFISAYLYLLIAGQNIPLWVYGVVGAMIAGGVYATVQKIRRELADSAS